MLRHEPKKTTCTYAHVCARLVAVSSLSILSFHTSSRRCFAFLDNLACNLRFTSNRRAYLAARPGRDRPARQAGLGQASRQWEPACQVVCACHSYCLVVLVIRMSFHWYWRNLGDIVVYLCNCGIIDVLLLSGLTGKLIFVYFCIFVYIFVYLCIFLYIFVLFLYIFVLFVYIFVLFLYTPVQHK